MALDKEKLIKEASFIRFCEIILGWDYFGLLNEADKEKKKEKRKRDNGADDDASSVLKQVKNSYKDVDDYLATFEPLLFEEVKAQIIRKKYDEEVAEWEMRLVVECKEAEGFILPAVTYGDDEGEKISQNDLLLLSREQFKDVQKLPETHAFALVEHRQHNLLRLRMFLDGEVMHFNTDNLKSQPRLLRMRNFITSPRKPEEKPLFSLKICSLSTISLEYYALLSISSLPFKDLILKATDKNSASEDQSWNVSGPLREHFVGNLNKSQLEAVEAGLSCKTFVLIQGPPGTGNTQTILALLSAVLHASPARLRSRGALREIKCGPKLPIQEKCVVVVYSISICMHVIVLHKCLSLSFCFCNLSDARFHFFRI